MEKKNNNTLNKISSIHSILIISNHVNESSKIRIYLLNTLSYNGMIILSNDTIKDLKVKYTDIIVN